VLVSHPIKKVHLTSPESPELKGVFKIPISSSIKQPAPNSRPAFFRHNLAANTASKAPFALPMAQQAFLSIPLKSQNRSFAIIS